MEYETQDIDKIMYELLIAKSNNQPKPINHPGEDIRAAKAIYEYVHGEQFETKAKLWMDFAREAADHFGIKGIQKTAEYLNIKTNRL